MKLFRLGSINVLYIQNMFVLNKNKCKDVIFNQMLILNANKEYINLRLRHDYIFYHLCSS